MNNPFIGRGAPVSGERLVGRDQEIRRLLSRMNAGAHCSVVGLARIGKTSVAQESLRQLNGAPGSPCCGYLTLDAIRCPADAYERILSETTAEGDLPAISTTRDHDEVYHHLLATLRKRKRHGERAVLVVDEFDAVTRSDFPDSQLFVSRIRELANSSGLYGVSFVFISRRSLDMIQGRVDCSTLAGLCEQIYLKPLHIGGMAALTARSPIHVDDSGREALWEMTGGHPFFAEVAMCEAVDTVSDNGEGCINRAVLEVAQHRQAHEFTNQYQQYSNLLAGDDTFGALCDVVIGPLWRPVSPHSIALLKCYGLIRSEDDETRALEAMSQHFRQYLGILSRRTPSWTLLGETEKHLRFVIDEQMQEAYGGNWLETIRERHPQLGDAIEKLFQQRTREKRMFGSAASDFVLDYAYIGDLKSLVFADWDRYRLLLGGAKKDWESRFQDIMKVRNPMAHHRVVPADVLQAAEQSCRSLLSRLAGDGSKSP